MAYQIKVPRTKKTVLPLGFPSISPTEAENLTGQVNGLEASAPEERMAGALRSAGLNFEFRHVIGAPKGMPGWKEIDFLVSQSGILYTMEMDTAFTHRSKEQKDKLHDALILNDPELKKYGILWPEVFHVDGDAESDTKEKARAYVRRRFGK